MKLLMKNTIVILFSVVIMLSTVVQAQDVGFGLKGGVNLTNLNVDDPEGSYDSRTGYHAGVFLRGKFGKVAIQPEVLLFTQSNEISSSTLGSVENNFTYLAVPVMFKFYVVSGLNIQAGPQFGFLLDGERKSQLQGLTVKEDIKDYYKNSDTSISLGGGFDFPFGLSVDARYNIGIKDINDEADGYESKSRVFLISLGWNFLK